MLRHFKLEPGVIGTQGHYFTCCTITARYNNKTPPWKVKFQYIAYGLKYSLQSKGGLGDRVLQSPTLQTTAPFRRLG